MKRFIGAVFVAALASLALATPAAASAEIRTDVIVRFADLDLGRTDDAAQLLGRIEHAARRACGGRPSGAAMLSSYREHRRCVRKAVAGAVDKLGAPVVSAIYNERSGRVIAFA